MQNVLLLLLLLLQSQCTKLLRRTAHITHTTRCQAEPQTDEIFTFNLSLRDPVSFFLLRISGAHIFIELEPLKNETHLLTPLFPCPSFLWPSASYELNKKYIDNSQ